MGSILGSILEYVTQLTVMETQRAFRRLQGKTMYNSVQRGSIGRKFA
jgi:hypothetical protein